ncbi:uncharacterized protein LOC135166259 isoform X2 [Diachasmimorpha longicaudata]|uniref:uncharacterized protein LOC135166259 isoform X2 n=1 Tax=Diachasmimorpha longicaudata TaxID=58733 RepID=UPI0030B899A8
MIFYYLTDNSIMSDFSTPSCSNSLSGVDIPAPNAEIQIDRPADPQVDDTPADSNLFLDYELLTSSDYLQSISPFTTKLVEIVMVVHLVKGSEIVTCKNVVHIDGAIPKQVSDRFNSGTTPFELVIQSNTVINDLGNLKTLPPSQSNIAPEVVPLIGLSKYKKIVAVKGFVKTPWAVIEKQTDSTNTCFGSIAADKFFVDVKISEYPLDYVCEFSKGQHVQCIGSVIRTFTSFYFCVQEPVCITLVDDQVVSLKDLLVCKPLIVASDNDAAGPSKKLKRNELLKKFLKKD